MADRTNDTPDLPADVLEDVEEYARGVVHGGFTSFEEAVQCTADYEERMTEGAARAVVERVWRERAAEQEAWPETTDVDRLLSVFEALEAGGVVARADFTCCQTCGHAEIGDEAAEDAHGYVFFHRQDTEGAVDGDGVWLAYGSFSEDGDRTEAVGREVADALTAGGLPVEWDGSVRTRIRVGPLAWQKRLPVG
ncbi:DUF6891 domain-containing protein [Saccharothrix xinjiangensis]|uniref:DUF6891 domain-containing protein n=1 Tax=Saccharothrix xinjiangensis TaxID=204798 RepID=A0ABV9XVJ7_9PSEU